MQKMSETEVKRFAQKTFWWSLCVVGFANALILTLGASIIAERLGYPNFNPGGFASAVLIINIVEANAITTWRCRQWGVSKAHRTIETIHRLPDADIAPPEETIEIMCPKSPWGRGMLSVFFALISIDYGCWYYYGAHSLSSKLLGIMGLALFIPCAILSAITVKIPEVKVDAWGIKGSHGLWYRSLQWQQIATCDLVTSYNVLGQPGSTYPIFKDEKGKVLMVLNPLVFLGVPVSERERVIQFIKARMQGKPTQTRTPDFINESSASAPGLSS